MQVNTPQWNFLKGIMSPLKGFTLFLHKNESDQSEKQHLPIQSWLELLYPSPQIILNLLNQLGQLPKMPPNYYLLDGILKFLQLLCPKQDSTGYVLSSDQTLNCLETPKRRQSHDES